MTKLDAKGDVLGQGVGQQTTLGRLMWKVYAAAVVLLILLASVFYLLLAGIEREQIAAHAADSAARLNGDVETLLLRYIDRVNLLAADPNLRELVQYPASRAVRAGDLAQMVGAQQVVLFAKGEERNLAGDYPLLSFAELNLVFEAEDGRQPRIEYHRLADGSAHFDIVRPLRQDGEVMGFVLARFEAGVFKEPIKRLAMEGARFELRQTLSEGEAETFLSWGDEALMAEGQAVEADVAHTAWKQRYWEAAQGWQLFGLDWRLVFALALLSLLLIMALVLLLFVQQLSGLVRKCATVFFGYVQDRLGGRWLGKKYFTPLKEAQAALRDLQELNWSALSSAAIATREPGQTQEAPASFSAAEESERGRKEFEQAYADPLYHDKEAIWLDEEHETHAAEAAPLREEERGQTAPAETSAPLNEESAGGVAASIFKAYDIRGIVDKTLNTDVAYQIGMAFGTEAWEQGEQAVVVGRDARPSSEALARALIAGLCDSGRDVIDIGMVPTPLMYFATHYLSARSGVMVTGSHNPAEYNGFKLVLRNQTLAEKAVQKIYQRILSEDYARGDGSYAEQDLASDYMARISADVEGLRGLRVVVDCGNGVAANIAPALLRSLGCNVIELFCEVDGSFPNHHPDPSRPENLQALIEAVRTQQADLGLAFDGDADRLGVVDSNGAIIWPDRLLMLYAKDVLRKHPGAQIIYDVKSSRYLRRVIEENGGQALMWKSGHSLLKAKMKETGAVLAGEMSGHIFFHDRWYGFDDALYSAVRLLEIISADGRSSAGVFADLPNALSTPELQAVVGEGRAAELMQTIKEAVDFDDAQINLIDGVRAEFVDGWGLVRASNTTPCLTFRFEAEDEAALARIKARFKALVLQAEPSLALPF